MARKPVGRSAWIDEAKPPWTGVLGHVWEQLALPVSCRRSLLWSPANTGPLACRNQVVTIHDLQQLEHPEWFATRFAAFYKFVIPRLVHRAARLIANSDFTKSRLVDVLNVAPDRIAVTPLGVDPSVYHQWTGEALRVGLERYGLEAASYVLYVGSLQPRKNLAGLVRAWKAIQPGLPSEMRLVVVGKAESPSMAAATRLPTNVGGLVSLGYVPDHDLPCLYSGAAALVNLSFYEGFGLPALEAMSCGTPVLVSDTTAFPEVVGDCGILVPPGNQGAVADALIALIGSPALRERLSTAGLERAKRFSWDTTAEKTWSILAEEAAAR